MILTERETEVKWYFDSIEKIVIVYIRNRLRGTFACACYTLYVYVYAPLLLLRCTAQCTRSSLSP